MVFMKMTFKVALASVLLASAVACTSTSEPSPSAVVIGNENDAKTRATNVVAGVAESAETEKDDVGVVAWSVRIRTANKALVEVVLLESTGELIEVADKDGPFDHDFASWATGQLKYADAKAKALATNAGTVVAWEFERKDSQNYQWEFYVRDASEKLWEIKLTGTGELKGSVEKPAVD